MDLKEWFFQASEAVAFTADAAELFEKRYQNVFVYDQCMSGFQFNQYLADELYLGSGWSVRRDLVLKKRYLGKETQITALTKGDGHIYGELYMVDTNTLLTLDELMSNGLFYNRVKDQVRLAYKSPGADEPHIQTKMAWVYYGVPKYWSQFKLTDCQNNGVSYRFTEKDLKPSSETT